MVVASDLFNVGEQVEILYRCPFRGLEGELTYVSDDSMQIEVMIGYPKQVSSERECSSYYRGLTDDIGKLK